MTSSRKLKFPQAQLGDPMTAKSVIGEEKKRIAANDITAGRRYPWDAGGSEKKAVL
jgi:hypothetical protein